MKITILGCGNAFSHKNFNQSFLIENQGKKLLIDCGIRTPMALAHAGINVKELDAIYVSHAHADHVGGLEEVAFLRYDWMTHPRKWSDGNYAPKLIGNVVLLKELWEHTLSGGLRSMEGFDATLETFFEPMPIEPNVPFMWQGWKFSLVQQIHVMTGSMFMNTFGLFMEPVGIPGKKVFFTTDCQYVQPEQVLVFYKNADIVMQDCETIGCDTSTKTLKFSSGVHASYAKLAGWASANAMKMSDEMKAKLYLSHYQDFVSEDKDQFGNDCDWNALALEDGIVHGFVEVGQEFEV
jgi:ribonuclease BN (tRNA processing enzyme)